MKKSLFITLFFAIAGLALTSCDKDDATGYKPELLISSANINAEPNPLEAIGGKVPVTVNITFPKGFLFPDATLSVTPVLVYSGHEAYGTTYSYQGTKVQGNNQVIPFDAATNVTIKSAFTYKPEMAKSRLYIEFDVLYKGGHTVFRIASIEGVIATAR